MNFWDLDHPHASLALLHETSAREWSYGDLRREADKFAREISAKGERRLGFVLSSNTPECVAAYIGSLRARHPVALFGAELARPLLASLLAAYQPDWVFAPGEVEPEDTYFATPLAGHHYVWNRRQAGVQPLSPELALLLSTSGSTGAPKLVRLSRANLQSNAEAICQYLHLDPRERPVTSLPFPYSYGLSVINSHLLAGATILLTDRSIVKREFWNFARDQRATSMAGVPYTYQVMLQAKLLDRDLPFATLTQAGGRLDPKYVDCVQAIAGRRGWKFFVMYGQTEATARISFVPPERLSFKKGSVGVPIPGGKLTVEADSGELIYEGPNVMLGYAESRADLDKGDELGGVLHTGDLGRQDEDGFFYITGRKRRFLKIFGQRVSLDDVERALSARFDGPFACFGGDDHLQIAVEDGHAASHIQHFVCEFYGIHHSAVHVFHLPELPVNTRGKVDYLALASGGVAGLGPSADAQP